MTADDQFFADVCRQFGRPVPPPKGCLEPLTVTAGIISAPRIVMATLRCLPGRQPRLVEQASCSFELSDRSAGAVLRLSKELGKFVRQRKVSEVYLRAHSERGKFAGHATNFKIEAVLQLVPGLHVTFVNTSSVGAWVKREDPRLPEPCQGQGGRWLEKQRLAIEAAMFVAMGPGTGSAFSDGSGRHD